MEVSSVYFEGGLLSGAYFGALPAAEIYYQGVRIYPLGAYIFFVSNYTETSWSQKYADNIRISTNKGTSNSTATISYKISGTSCYGIYVVSDGQASYDYVSLKISAEDGTSVFSKDCVANEYGQLIGCDNLYESETYNVVITYTKDGSTNLYTDRGYILLHGKYKDEEEDKSQGVGNTSLLNAYQWANKPSIGSLSVGSTSLNSDGGNISLSASGSTNMSDAAKITYFITEGDGYGYISGDSLHVNPNDSTEADKTIKVKAKASYDYYPSQSKSSAMTQTSESEERTITVKKKEYTYRITFNANGGSGSVPSDVTFENTSVTKTIGTEVPSKNGRKFCGWSNTSDFSSTRIYKGEGGDSDYDGVSAVSVGNWTIGTFCEKFGINKESLPASNAERTLTLYAQWLVEYTVSLFVSSTIVESGSHSISVSATCVGSDGSTKVPVFSVTSGASYGEFNASYTNFTFYENTSTDERSVTLRASYGGAYAEKTITQKGASLPEKTYTVTLVCYNTSIDASEHTIFLYPSCKDSQGGTHTPSLTITTGSSYARLSGTTLTVYANTTGSARTITVRAYYEDAYDDVTITQSGGVIRQLFFNEVNANTVYRVEVNGNIVNIGSYYEAEDGETITVEAFYSPVYRIKRIYDNYGVEYSNPFTHTVNGGRVFYIETESASTPTVYTYRITFDANGGSGVPSDMTFATKDEWGARISATIPTRANHTFLGWTNYSWKESPRVSRDTIYADDGTMSQATYDTWSIEDICSVFGTTAEGLTIVGSERVLTLYAVWQNDAEEVEEFTYYCYMADRTTCLQGETKATRNPIYAPSFSGKRCVGHNVGSLWQCLNVGTTYDSTDDYSYGSKYYVIVFFYEDEDSGSGSGGSGSGGDYYSVYCYSYEDNIILQSFDISSMDDLVYPEIDGYYNYSSATVGNCIYLFYKKY